MHMAKSRIFLPLLFLFLVAAASLHHAAAAGRKVGGWVSVKNVDDNKALQELGRYCVGEYNRRGGNASAQLVFSRVVAAETQVVSGIKYRLKISAAVGDGALERTFEAVVVVKPWQRSKHLVDFAPSQPRLNVS